MAILLAVMWTAVRPSNSWRQDLKPQLTAFRAHRLICWPMTEDIEKLISSLRLGHFEDSTERIGLLAAALLEQNADLSLILSLIRAPQVPLRLAAIQASRDRAEPELLTATHDSAKTSRRHPS